MSNRKEIASYENRKHFLIINNENYLRKITPLLKNYIITESLSFITTIAQETHRPQKVQ